MCFPSQSILSEFSWENQIVNLYGLAELHMENCLAEYKAQLGLSWQAELENISTWRLPPTLLWFVLCFVCLLSWAIPLAGHLSSLVYDSSHNVWIVSLTFVWFLEGPPLWTTMSLKQQYSHRDSDTAGSVINCQPVASSFSFNFFLKIFV